MATDSDDVSWLVLFTARDLGALMNRLARDQPEWVDGCSLAFDPLDDDATLLVVRLADPPDLIGMPLIEIAEAWLLNDESEAIEAIYNVARRRLS